MNRPAFPAYAASFRQGMRDAFDNRSAMATSIVIYAVLMAIFSSIFRIMPLEELGVEGLTPARMLWYFAITECVIVSGSGGVNAFGRMIAEGRLGEMMQRPCDMLLLFAARLLGGHAAMMMVLLSAACVLLPLLGMMRSFHGAQMLLLPVMLLLGCVQYILIGYIVSTIEVLGPYSRPMGWIVGKFVFAFGGLFFPVSFFPAWLEKIVMLTPFPYVIYAPGSVMLGAEWPRLVVLLGGQLFWCAALWGLARFAGHRMESYAMHKGVA